jgi:PAS domain S-box-containing protein
MIFQTLVLIGLTIFVILSLYLINMIKKSQEALKKSEARYRDLWENANDIFYIHDLEGRFIAINRAGREILRYSEQEVRDLTIKDVVSEEHLPLIEESIKSIVAKNPAKPCEILFYSKYGTPIWVEIRSRPIIEDGKVVAIQGVARDITQRKNMEKSLKRKNEILRSIFEIAPDAIGIADKNLRIIDGFDSIASMFGYSREEVVGKKVFDIISESEHDKIVKAAQKMFEKGYIRCVELKLKRKDGSEFIGEVSASALRDQNGEFAGFIAIVRDITERKVVENRLKESEEMFRKLAEKSLVGVYLIQDGVFKYVNPKFAELWGSTPEDMIGRSPLEFVHPDDRELVERNLKLRIDGIVDAVNYSLRIVRGEEVRINEVFGSRVIYGGKPAVVGTLIDITERVEMERKIREGEEKFRKIFETTPNLIAIIDKDGFIVEANPSMIRNLGINPTDKNICDILPAEVAENRMKIIREVITKNEPVELEDERDGKYFKQTFLPIEISGRKHCLVIAQDLTEHIRLNRLLNAINNINKLIVLEKNVKSLIEKACKELASIYPAFTICLYDEWGLLQDYDEKECRVFWESEGCRLVFTKEMKNCLKCKEENDSAAISVDLKGESKGIIRIYSNLGEREKELLLTMAKDIAYAIRVIQIDEIKRQAYEQINHNIEQFAILVDEVRNPLTVILSLAELKVDNKEVAGEIIEQVERIEELCEKLESGWLESEKVRQFLRKFE